MDSDPDTLPTIGDTGSSPEPAPEAAPAVPRHVPRRDIRSIKFVCGACGQHIEAARDCFGEVMPCPACGVPHQIPDVKNAPRSFPVRRVFPRKP